MPGPQKPHVGTWRLVRLSNFPQKLITFQVAISSLDFTMLSRKILRTPCSLKDCPVLSAILFFLSIVISWENIMWKFSIAFRIAVPYIFSSLLLSSFIAFQRYGELIGYLSIFLLKYSFLFFPSTNVMFHYTHWIHFGRTNCYIVSIVEDKTKSV